METEYPLPFKRNPVSLPSRPAGLGQRAGHVGQVFPVSWIFLYCRLLICNRQYCVLYSRLCDTSWNSNG